MKLNFENSIISNILDWVQVIMYSMFTMAYQCVSRHPVTSGLVTEGFNRETCKVEERQYCIEALTFYIFFIDALNGF